MPVSSSKCQPPVPNASPPVPNASPQFQMPGPSSKCQLPVPNASSQYQMPASSSKCQLPVPNAPSSKCLPPVPNASPSTKYLPLVIVLANNSRPGPQHHSSSTNPPVTIPSSISQLLVLNPFIRPPVAVLTNRSTLLLLPIRVLRATRLGLKFENPPPSLPKFVPCQQC